jgi:hypothetical protein
MRFKSPLQTLFIYLSAMGLALAFASGLRAGGYTCHCEPSLEVFCSPFYGYYRTCWRPWPGGQPPCPCYPTPPAAEQPTPPAATTERTIEMLPPPRPEEPESKETKEQGR